MKNLLSSAFNALANTKESLSNASTSLVLSGVGALGSKRKGAFAFEYIIVLVLMVTIIIGAWNILGEAIMAKVNEVDSTIRGITPGTWNGN